MGKRMSHGTVANVARIRNECTVEKWMYFWKGCKDKKKVRLKNTFSHIHKNAWPMAKRMCHGASEYCTQGRGFESRACKLFLNFFFNFFCWMVRIDVPQKYLVSHGQWQNACGFVNLKVTDSNPVRANFFNLLYFFNNSKMSNSNPRAQIFWRAWSHSNPRIQDWNVHWNVQSHSNPRIQYWNVHWNVHFPHNRKMLSR